MEIRRQKREENISKRRNFLPSTGGDSDEEIGGGSWDPPVSENLIFQYDYIMLTTTSNVARRGNDFWCLF